eukprot:TRINITY_DN2201_c0_g1_i1.p1 TRINITY_DN2201_c0_g1~~TRINITY_DN2201_c0_g1_i1.p1  ORF type:complete len:324 (+),score=44.26 TRINITY_DN2201_c0_g1_i1:62-1033(+)
MKCTFGWKSALLILVLAWITWKACAPRMQWHAGPNWSQFLTLYDGIAKEQYAKCDSPLLPTRFGLTQVHACGNSSLPPVLLFPGAGSCSLIWGDWIVPSLLDKHYAIAVDFVCDTGRSSPLNMSVSNCPKTEQDLVMWTKDVLLALHIQKPSLVGYSYGSFIAATVTSLAPELVDRLVLIAPAGVFAPVEFGLIWRGLASIMFGAHKWLFEYLSSVPNFKWEDMPLRDRQLAEASSLLTANGACVLNVPATPLPIEQLQKIGREHRALLIIGDEEKCTNATVAVENAKRAGFEVQLFPHSGHLLIAEHPREPVKGIVAAFLRP